MTSPDEPAVQAARIDHVHVFVADRDVAAGWYSRVLGLSRHEAVAKWAKDPQGPLILAGADGYPTLSLFASGERQQTRTNTVAFRVSGSQFIAFLGKLKGLQLADADGSPVTSASAVDHDLAWSIYFVDPDGNPLEVTTYDAAVVRLARDAGST